MKSARRSIQGRVAGAGSSEVNSSIDKDRPPMYVPSRRDSGARGDGRGIGLRDSQNGAPKTTYQPKTSFSYVPSAEV